VFSATGADFSESCMSNVYMQANHGDFGGWHQYPTTAPAARSVYNFERLSGGGAAIWTNNSMLRGGRGFRLFMHEIGHGLSLAHPHDTDMGTNLLPGVMLDTDLGTNGYNQHVYSIMSYNEGPYQTTNANVYGHSATSMAFDIAAMQFLYGADATYQSGGDTYTLPTLNALGETWRSLWDTGGSDTIFSATATTSATIDLRAATLTNGDPNAGDFISQVVGVFGGVVIENAIGGSGNDTLTGNSADNILDGGTGLDAMTGGNGNDTYYIDLYDDTVLETVGNGFNVIVNSATSCTISANTELLVVSSNGTSGTGSSEANILQATGSGTTLTGGDGNDIYYFTSANTTVGETVGQGFDTAILAGTRVFTLGAKPEALALVAANSTGIGNNAGNSFLACAENCTLVGGTGNDYYVLAFASDVIQEQFGGGFDIILSIVATTTQAKNVEQLYVIAQNGTGIANGGGGTLFASNAGVTLASGQGNHNLYGNGLGTTFKFNANFGDGLIAGFTATSTGSPTHDVVDLSAINLAGGFAALNFTDATYGTSLTIGDGSILLYGVQYLNRRRVICGSRISPLHHLRLEGRCGGYGAGKGWKVVSAFGWRSITEGIGPGR
jgi:Ca2+-binding RTX toxin-like protein